ncbi:MAG: hypothetical protein LBT66_02955 [Methanobrevibacter sp.]|jgi:epoxyqueuosine reductase QueG|nr:hypothetical protein [Candidatus Methanovirga meridionalis]
MKNFIIEKIKNFVIEDDFNKHDFSNGIGFEEPLIHVASSNNLIFEEYKTIIGEFHLSPKEIFEMEFGKNSLKSGSVISVSLPISEYIVKSNRKQQNIPSKEWTLLRSYGQEYQVAEYLSKILNEKGYKTIIPAISKYFKIITKDENIVSNWSERHIAYATGLGTFSLNQGFITEKGISNRLVSLVTDLNLKEDLRTFKHHNENCLYFFNGKCKACKKRCPINAISKKGIDKYLCREQLYGEKSIKIAISRGANQESGSGCGLCQTNVPCERKNPTTELKLKNLI